MSEQRAVQVRVTGRVQGVCFRVWTQAEARQLGLAGWVRNERDGSVSALLVGRDDAVATMIERLHSGPPGARVADVRAEDVEQSEPPDGFRITG